MGEEIFADCIVRRMGGGFKPPPIYPLCLQNVVIVLHDCESTSNSPSPPTLFLDRRPLHDPRIRCEQNNNSERDAVPCKNSKIMMADETQQSTDR